MNRLKSKTVLITGASSGIGEACAKRFADMETNLILAARRTDRLEALAQKLKKVSVTVKKLDVTKREDVEAFAEETAAKNIIPDIIVNNAGLCRGKDRFFEADINDWEEMIDTNIKGLLYISRVFAPYMVKRNSGHIINIGSTAGEQVYEGGNVYNMTKFAVKALSQAMNLDLSGTDIKVTNIAPGMAQTEFSLVRYRGDKEKADATYEAFTPLQADDVADAVIYAANTAPHVNVQHIIVAPTAQRSSNVVIKK